MNTRETVYCTQVLKLDDQSIESSLCNTQLSTSTAKENMQYNTNTPCCTGPSRELKCSSSSEKTPVPLDRADPILLLDTEAEDTPLVRSPLSGSLDFLVRNWREANHQCSPSMYSMHNLSYV